MKIALRSFTGKLFSEITEIPPLLQQSHLPSLDGLRAISIIIVLVFHVLLRSNSPNFNGMFGVNIFFVISGFIITTILLKEKLRKEEISLKNFYIRRFLKIIPVAYLYLGIIILLNLYYHFSSKREIVSAVFFIKNTRILSTIWDWPTAHFWSLSVEEQFYIFFPFILKKSTNNYLVIVLILLVAIPVPLALENANVGAFSTFGMHAFLDFFRFITPILTGALFSVLIFKKVIVKKIYPNNLVINILLLLAAYWAYAAKGFLFTVQCHNLVSSLLVAALIVNNIFHSTDWFFKILNWKPLAAIGIASYSIYVWQQIFLLAIPWKGAFKYADSLWFNLSALSVVSFLSYYFIERQLVRIKSRYK